MALSLNDKKVKRSALGEVKQHLPKKTAVMPWQDISPSFNESERAEASSLGTKSENLEPKLSQSEAKVEPKLSQSEAKVEPAAKACPLSSSTAKLEPKLSQSEAKVEPSHAAATPVGMAKLEPKLSQSEAKVEPGQTTRGPSSGTAKLEPKLSQSEAKVEPTESVGVPGSGAAKLEPKLSQSEAKVEPIVASDSINLAEAKLEPKLSQAEASLDSPGRDSYDNRMSEQDPVDFDSALSSVIDSSRDSSMFSLLVGLQRSLVVFFYKMVDRSADRSTPPLSIQSIASAASTTCSSVRKAIQRLEEKGCIERAAFKDGRGGWTRYRLNAQIYQTLCSAQENLSQTAAKVEPNCSQS